MENGWVYWSNWDGMADVTSDVQVQRGLGASNLIVASVGGTINIKSSAADMDRDMVLNKNWVMIDFLKLQ